MKLKITRLSEKAVIPKIAYNNTSAAFDITATETISIKPGEFGIVPNDLRICIPEGEKYFMYINLRSSLGFKRNLICHHGIVDPGYTGDIGVKVYNIGKEVEIIKEGERYAQILILPFEIPEFEELTNEEFEEFAKTQQRNNSGFGSSGK